MSVRGEKNQIGKNKVMVPASVWKIVMILAKPGIRSKGVTAETRVIAVNIPNTLGIKTSSYKEYLTTVDALEKLTGYDFLSDVPQEIQDEIEAKKDGE